MFFPRSSLALALFFVAFLYVVNDAEAQKGWDAERKCILKNNPCKYLPAYPFPSEGGDDVTEEKEYPCCPSDTICTVHSETRWYCRLNTTVVSLRD